MDRTNLYNVPIVVCVRHRGTEMTINLEELKAAAEAAMRVCQRTTAKDGEMKVKLSTILTLLAERQQLLKIAEAADAVRMSGGRNEFYNCVELMYDALKEWKK